MTFVVREGKNGYEFYNGTELKVPRTFTLETGRESAEKFCILLNAHYDEAVSLSVQYYAAIQLNHELSSKGQRGIDRPIFNAMERFLNRLQKQVGIINT